MSLSESSINHLDQVRRLAFSLAQLGISVLEHEFNVFVFGSFTLVVGKPKHRLKFEWDGREFFLNISVAECPSSDIIAKWIQKDNLRLPPQRDLDPFDKIEELALKEFGIQSRNQQS